jgi:hypothetical protein
MRVNVTEPRQTSIPSNVEPEGKPAVGVVSYGGESRRQKQRLGGRTAGRDFLGVFQKKENEKEMLDIQKREGSGGSTSETPIDMQAAAIETMDRTAEDLRRNHKKGQNWVSMR